MTTLPIGMENMTVEEAKSHIAQILEQAALIHVYTREQNIADGALVDVTECTYQEHIHTPENGITPSSTS